MRGGAIFNLIESMENSKILIADDNESIRRGVAEILQDAGFVPVTAEDGCVAVEKIYNENPALCILDYEMPCKTGFEVVREIRSRAGYVNMPIIIFTAVNDKETKLYGLGLDIDEYITKPADSDEIVARVKLLLRRSRQRLASNPLTMLPGNYSIQTETERRIQSGVKFAVLYCDLNNFKAFNDKYGFEIGDRALLAFSNILQTSAAQDPDSFVGNIGGDDFIIICAYDKAESICKQVIEDLALRAPSLYDEKDRTQGFMESHDRRGETQRFALLSVGIGVVHNNIRPLTSYAQVSSIGSELKSVAKQEEVSAYVFDRRVS